MRFEKQELFAEIGKEGQRQLKDAHVLILGCGALGSVAAELLVRAGVGEFILIDRDFVELSNLQRQSLYTEKDVGSLKALVLASKLKEINRKVKVKALPIDLDHSTLLHLDADLILDCTDNFYTRFLLNDYAKKEAVPWVHASARGSSGFVYAVLPERPCFSCIFDEPTAPLGSCDTEGILNTVVHLVSAVQVTQALKILTGKEPSSDLFSFDIWKDEQLKLKVKKKKGCPACLGNFEYLSGKKAPGLVKMCGSNLYQIKGERIDLEKLSQRLSRLGTVRKGQHALFFKELVVFRDGRALIKTKDEQKAKILYERYLG